MQPTAELFTEQAWGAIVAAQQLAQQKHQPQIETEHLNKSNIFSLKTGYSRNSSKTSFKV